MGIVLSYILAILVVGMVLVGIVFLSVSYLRVIFLEAVPHSVSDYIYRHFLIWPMKERYKGALKQHSPFYSRLDRKDKKSFEKRVQRFISSKEFISRGGQRREVNDSKKVQIAATAIQLTYGHPSIYLSHFGKILIYPDSYYSTITKLRHQGEVNVRGFIVLSWSNFQKGFSISDDGVHLGFHEMAHALQLENLIENDEYNFLDKDALAQVRSIEKEERSKGQSTFFRESAFQNRFEFFAVTVESFFERPLELKAYSPELYSQVCGILRHDPLTFLGSASKRGVRF